MDNDLLLSNERVKNASKKLTKVHDSVAEMQTEMRNQSRDFYFRLALLTGGVLSLSITFIGYLTSKSSTLIFSELLYLSWFSLVASILGSLYRNHFHGNMGHWQTTNSLNEVRLEEHRAMLDLLDKNPQQFINLKTKQDVEKQIKVTKENIKTIENAIKKVESNNEKSAKLWIFSQNSAHLGFVIGLLSITVFAALNLPVRTEFTIFNYLNFLYKK